MSERVDYDEKRCATCGAWEHLAGYVPGQNCIYPQGECRRRAPGKIPGSRSFPMTNSHDWCGQFSRASSLQLSKRMELLK
jgi:hypothetical protein